MHTPVTVVEAEKVAIKLTLAREEGWAISQEARRRSDDMLRTGRIESHEYAEDVLGQARDLLIADRRRQGRAWLAFREEWTAMAVPA